jgi:ketosteroid isomerase-like protein
MDDRAVRLALQRHWDASDASDFTIEHEIYREDAVLYYPQSGERIHGRHNIQESRFVQPEQEAFYRPADYRQRQSLDHRIRAYL